MFKDEKPHYYCSDLPNIRLTFKNKEKTFLVIYFDTVSSFESHMNTYRRTVSFTVDELHPEDYCTIIENFSQITEIDLETVYFFKNDILNNMLYKHINYEPFNELDVYEVLNSSNQKTYFCFELNKKENKNV